jgi:UPF0755 protein
MRKFGILRTLAGALVLLALFAVVLAFVIYGRMNAPYRGYDEPVQLVEIPSGLSTRAIGQRLIAAGVIQDEWTYRTTLWLSGNARRLQAGEYRFDRPMTPSEVIDKIARGDVDRLRVTFPEGLTIAEMSRIFESSGLGPADGFIAAAANVALVSAIDPDARDLEGYLFPDTYSVPRHIDAPQLVRVMTARFTDVANDALRAEARAHGWSVRQLVTLASLVEKETSRAEERPIVAAVYANRVRLGMPLQCDPTVIYALDRAGKYNGNLRRDDLAFNSPYNTYRYAGLPPGPIAAPGKLSLEAVARPADADFLYFVSRNDGSHVFARTLAEHNRNVQQYQVQFFRDRRAGGTGRAGR